MGRRLKTNEPQHIKPLLLLMLEGTTDHRSLFRPISRLLTSVDVDTIVTDGDLCLRENANVNTIIDDVSSQISGFLERNPYRRQQALQVAHILDSDAVFASDRNNERFYRKAEMLRTLSSLSSLQIGPLGLTVPYRTYYMSRNLEHVLHNKGERLPSDEKDALARNFSKLTRNDPRILLETLAKSAVPGDYKATWDYLCTGDHSLERLNNLLKLFEPYWKQIEDWSGDWPQ